MPQIEPDLDIESNRISQMAKEFFKSIVKTGIKEHVFLKLMERKNRSVSEYARGRLLKWKNS